MEAQLHAADRQVLVEMVKLSQKHELKGKKGDWKEFLNIYDKNMGDRVSDPSRRSKDILVAFLKTFTSKNEREFFTKVMRCHRNRSLVKQFMEASPNEESPEQVLVRLTLEHPLYPIDYSLPSCDEEWVVTKLSEKPKNLMSTSMVAIDCEMVLCEDGTEACVKVSVIDRNFEIKLNELVHPGNAIADYRTGITGVSAEDLVDVKCSLADVQKALKKILSHGTILVGHALDNDLNVLKFDYARIIDTSYIFQYAETSIQRRPSLSNLCKSVLGYELRKKGTPHNCLEDATAVMKLVVAVIDRGVNREIPYLPNDVARSKTAKLLLHRIPSDVMIDELHGAIPGKFTVDVKPKRARGKKYSAYAIFSSVEEAYEAFDSLEGTIDKDSQGRTQKVITFQLKTGTNASLCVRQIFDDETNDQISAMKRVGEATMVVESKKFKEMGIAEDGMVAANHCHDHLKEIERLKQELSEKDLQLQGRCQQHLKEIEELKGALSMKEIEISALHDIVKEQKKKAMKTK